MEINYKYDISHNYAIIKSDDDIDNSYKFRMILDNKLKGIISISTRIIDNEFYLYYDISSRHSMKEIFDKKQLGYYELQQLIVALYSRMNELSKYLLDIDDIILEPELIFYNLEKTEIFFCYYPNLHKNFGSSFHHFIQCILTKIDHSDKDAVLLAYDLQDVSLNDRLIIDDVFNKLSLQKKDAKIEEVHAYKKEELNIIYDNPFFKKAGQHKEIFAFLGIAVLCLLIVIGFFFYSGYIYKKYGYIVLVIFIGLIMGIAYKKTHTLLYQNEKVNLGDNNTYNSFDMEETVLLNWADDKKYLEYIGEGEKEFIDLCSFPFSIGKLKNQVNYVIEEPGISRIHARITTCDGDYFIEDIGSTNGTFINNERIKSYTKIKLEHGDIIKFANIPYKFN